MGGKQSPDFGDMATAQTEANEGVVRDQTYANRPTQYTPWGYTNWTNQRVQDPGTGEYTTQWTQTQGLTPELQEVLNKQIAIQGGRTDLAGGLTSRMMNEFGRPMEFGGLNPLRETPQEQYTLPENFEGLSEISDPTALRQRSEDLEFAKARSRLDPMFEQRRNAMEIKLRNQGLRPGDEAWNSQMSGIGQQETDAYNQAMFGASAAGRQEAGQLFGQDMSRRQQGVGERQSQFDMSRGANAQNFGQSMTTANYANQLRQQQLTEAMQERGFSLNEINALLSGQQVGMPQMPTFAQAGASQPGPIYQSGVDQSNFEQMQQQGLYSGLGGLGQAAIGAWGMRG